MLISIPIRNKSNHSSFPALSHEEHDARKHARGTWKECGHSNGLGTNRYNMRSTLKRCQTSGSHLFVEWIITYGSGECWIFGSLIRFVHRCEFALVEWGESGWRAKWGSPTMVFQADQFLRRAPRRAGGGWGGGVRDCGCDPPAKWSRLLFEGLISPPGTHTRLPYTRIYILYETAKPLEKM